MRKKNNRKKAKRLKRRKKIRKEIPKISLKAIKGLKISKKIKQLKELNQLLNRKKNRIINKQINRLKGFSLRNSANLISQSFNKVYEDLKKEQKIKKLKQIKLEKIVPKQWLMTAHHLLIFHGRYVCKARNPECYKCVVNDLCLFKNKNLI